MPKTALDSEVSISSCIVWYRRSWYQKLLLYLSQVLIVEMQIRTYVVNPVKSYFRKYPFQTQMSSAPMFNHFDEYQKLTANQGHGHPK